MKKLSFIGMFLVIIISLSACQKNPSVDTEQKKDEIHKIEDQTDETQNKEATISVDYFEDNKDLKDYIDFTEQRYENDEYLTKLVIRTDNTIKNVKLIDVETGHNVDGMTKFYIKDIIYELDTLTPEKPLVFGTVFPNFMANHVISYEDPTGAEKIFSISMSGEDGSIILAPAEFEEENMPLPNANVVMNFVDNVITSEFQEYYEYHDEVYNNPDYQMNILITTDQVISDVKIYSGQIGTVSDSSTGFEVEKTLFELGNIYPDVPLLYITEFPGDMPSRCISYKDTDGVEKIFALSMSGKDGSLVYIPVDKQ